LITDKYVEAALSLGARRAAPFEAEQIFYDPRVFLKCAFGCADFGKLHTCPYQRSPLTMEDYEKIFKRYERGIVIGCGDKKSSQRISYEIERACFLDGYYFAFSLSDCGLCDECAKKFSQDCRVPSKARPAFHGVGIDVFKTVRGLGLPIEILKSEADEQNWYSAVFIE